MYARTYGDKTYTWEPSGGLINGALVMQDFETDSYWYLMTHKALAGPARGTKLTQLPVSEKTTWRDWVRKHPETLVLSVRGKEHVFNEPYANYFDSKRGFRGLTTPDKRLLPKESIFAFTLGGEKVAAPHKTFVGGGLLEHDGAKAFLYRPRGAPIFLSTMAFDADHVVKRGKHFLHQPSGAVFDPKAGAWTGGRSAPPKRLRGFDTFWVSWSLANPKAVVLSRKRYF